MKKICFVVSGPMAALVFLLPHIKTLSLNYQISMVANTIENDLLQRNGVNVQITYVPIQRFINILADFRALILLFFLYRRQKFDVVHSVTPKAGFLAMSAAWLARVPVRVHIYTGQVWATKTGFARFFLKTFDRCIAYCATNVLVDSGSQRDFLLSEGVIDSNNSVVLGNGSICGVNIERFHPDRQARELIRRQFSIPDSAIVLLFLGRMNYEKGILDLLEVFETLAAPIPSLWLLLVGPDEQNMKVSALKTSKHCNGRVVEIGYTSKPEQFMAAADIFCMPSYREGFGSSVIEAAACGIPAVASRIYGSTDAVDEGITGLLHPPRDLKRMAECIEVLALNNELRHKMGDASRERCVRLFNQGLLTSAMLNFYQKIIEK